MPSEHESRRGVAIRFAPESQEAYVGLVMIAGACLLAIAGAWRLLADGALPAGAFALTADVRGDDVVMSWPGREWLTGVATWAGAAAGILVLISLGSVRAAGLALPAFALFEGLALTSVSARFALDEGRPQLALALLIAAAVAAAVGVVSALGIVRPGRALARLFPWLAALAIGHHLIPLVVPGAMASAGAALPAAGIGFLAVALAIGLDLEWIRTARQGTVTSMQRRRAAVLGAAGLALSLGWLLLESLELARFLPGVSS